MTNALAPDPRNRLTRPGCGLGALVWYHDRPYRVMTLATARDIPGPPLVTVTLGDPDHVTRTGRSPAPPIHIDVPLIDIETQIDRADRLAAEVRSW